MSGTIEIKNRIRQAAINKSNIQNPIKAQSIPIKKQTVSENSITTFLGICIVVLSVFIFYTVAVNKDKNLLSSIMSKANMLSQLSKVEPIKESFATKDSLKETNLKIDEINGKIAENNKTVAILNDKIWLLALINNENTKLNIMKNGNSKYGYVYLDQDWHLNKMPVTMKFTEEQTKKLSRNVLK